MKELKLSCMTLPLREIVLYTGGLQHCLAADDYTLCIELEEKKREEALILHLTLQ